MVDHEALLEVQADYLRATREMVATMRSHAKALSSRKLFKSAFPILLYMSHQLKGSGGSLGFPLITDLARQMSVALDLFLDDAAERPTPSQLSTTLLELAQKLDAELDASEAKLKAAPDPSLHV